MVLCASQQHIKLGHKMRLGFEEVSYSLLVYCGLERVILQMSKVDIRKRGKSQLNGWLDYLISLD